MQTPHAGRLRRTIALAAPLLEARSARFWQHDHLAALFPEFLLTIHGSVRATVPLMTEAVLELRERFASHPLSAPLRDYYEHHIDEEREHQEWLEDDLRVLGYDIDAVRRRSGSAAVASLAGAQYYWIRHAHPVALLGLFAVLEGHPPTIDHLGEIQARTGLPSEAFRMLRHHAELDAEHAAELFELIDRLPLDPSHAELLGVSALHTMGAVGEMFDTLVVAAPSVIAARARKLEAQG